MLEHSLLPSPLTEIHLLPVTYDTGYGHDEKKTLNHRWNIYLKLRSYNVQRFRQVFRQLISKENNTFVKVMTLNPLGCATKC